MPARLALFAVLAAALLIPTAAPAAVKIKTAHLWATVNVCDTPSSPDTIGLRGSMPGIRRKGAVMFMRFQVQYRTAAKKWKSVPTLDTAFLRIGSAKVASREAGHSFTLKPPGEGGSFVLRGVLTFQWRTKAGTVIEALRRLTSGGHKSTAAADPPGYSAATCKIS